VKTLHTERILVTGGAGFLGSHLCEQLLSRGSEVLCVDNFFTGSKQNVRDLMDDPGFELVRHDVTFPLYLEVDEIYNLACPASPVHYQHDPIQTTKTSVHGAINMLGLAKRVRARILQASTSEVYGDPRVHPQSESYWGHVNPVGLRSCYDEGKRCAETLFFDYQREVGLQIKVARIFNTYGPRMNPGDGRVVSNFIVQALTKQPITLYGDGSQTRAFCYVDDMIDGLLRLMETGDPARSPRSRTSRFPAMIPLSAARTSGSPGRPWAGSPPRPWRRGSRRPSPTSTSSSAGTESTRAEGPARHLPRWLSSPRSYFLKSESRSARALLRACSGPPPFPSPGLK
jgi:UDP-glucuronate decarboxylase